MNISIIVAVAKNNAIGKNNQLLWHLPNDMKFFKQTTWSMPVVMGRKTFESLNNKPLVGRLNIVVTKQKEFSDTNVVTVNNIDDALFVAKEHLYNEVFIIGGGEIYKQTIDKANKLYITKVDVDIEGDTFFPEFYEDKFELKKEESFKADEKHLYDYCFQIWEKN